MRKTQFSIDNFYHIFNRGVEKRDIFIDDRDRWRFLQGLFLFNDENVSLNTLWQVDRNFGITTFNTLKQFLSDKKRKPLTRIIAYCLMPNHYHLIFEEIIDGGISKFMQKFGTGYTMYFNKKYNRVGSLFQGTFKSVITQNQKQLERLLFYVNVINPAQIIDPDLKENGLINFEETLSFVNQYPWSTHQEYLNLRESVIIEKGILGEIFGDVNKYRDFSSSILKEKQYGLEQDGLFID